MLGPSFTKRLPVMLGQPLCDSLLQSLNCVGFAEKVPRIASFPIFKLCLDAATNET